MELHHPILLDQLIRGHLPRQKTAGENIIILLGSVWMQLLTSLHNPTEQTHQAISGDWGCPDILGGSTALADSGEHQSCSLMVSVCQWTTRATPTGILQLQPICQQSLPPPRAQSWAGLCLTALGALSASVQAPSQEDKGTFEHSQCPVPVCSQHTEPQALQCPSCPRQGKRGCSPSTQK